MKDLGVSSNFVFAELSAAFPPIHEWFTVECFGGELCSESRDEVTQDESFSQLLILIIHAEKGGERCVMSSWRPYKCRKGGQSEAPWDISALVTYICVAITEFLLKPVYRKEGRQPLKLTPLLVKGKRVNVLVCFMSPCLGLLCLLSPGFNRHSKRMSSGSGQVFTQ